MSIFDKQNELIEIFNNPTKHIICDNGQIIYSQQFVEAMEITIEILQHSADAPDIIADYLDKKK